MSKLFYVENVFDLSQKTFAIFFWILSSKGLKTVDENEDPGDNTLKNLTVFWTFLQMKTQFYMNTKNSKKKNCLLVYLAF